MIIKLSEVRTKRSKEKHTQEAIDSNEKFILSEEKNPLQFIPSEAFNQIYDIQGYGYLKNGLLISKHISSPDDVFTNILWNDTVFGVEKAEIYGIIKGSEAELLKKDLGIPFYDAQTHCKLSGGFMISFPEYICTLEWLKSNREKKSNQNLEDSLTIEGVEWLDSIISKEQPNISRLKIFPSYNMVSHPENYKSLEGFGIKMNIRIKTKKDSREYNYINEMTIGKLKVTNSLFIHGACNYFNPNYELSAICRGSYKNDSHLFSAKHTNIQNIPPDTIKYCPNIFMEIQKPSVRICYKVK
ncbi:MAG: hypothetical protein KAS15_07175 [Nanoarchaeota archaeon]|nr:hypothetical protein [Nanoarchaeota archaeon]